MNARDGPGFGLSYVHTQGSVSLVKDCEWTDECEAEAGDQNRLPWWGVVAIGGGFLTLGMVTVWVLFKASKSKSNDKRKRKEPENTSTSATEVEVVAL